ncbi:hypothetical protein COO60DRAFT_899593 [Scenedesmus sp. NREL 46B-D3]|nr:hypothetical protein COO60DRAFT_899593 [Scenedesmus sp. NREL 46B-D3]
MIGARPPSRVPRRAPWPVTTGIPRSSDAAVGWQLIPWQPWSSSCRKIWLCMALDVCLKDLQLQAAAVTASAPALGSMAALSRHSNGQQQQQQQQQDSAGWANLKMTDAGAAAGRLRKLQREANRVLEPAWGSDAAAFAALGARCVELQAVPAQGKCQVPGCSRDAVVLCSDCKPGGVLFCPRHDSEQHPFAHEHRRAALTSGFKHPLRPTQQYEDGQAQGQQRQQLRVHEQQQAGGQHASWPDVVKVFDLPPGRACGCANDSSAKHWVLQERSVQEQRKPLIVVGQSGPQGEFGSAQQRLRSVEAGATPPGAVPRAGAYLSLPDLEIRMGPSWPFTPRVIDTTNYNSILLIPPAWRSWSPHWRRFCTRTVRAPVDREPGIVHLVEDRCDCFG